MEDDLNQLRVFVEVARQGGVSAAARVLDMPTSTVSRWVQQLEKGLGVRLLQRTTRTIQLTEIGEGYYQRALRAVASLEEWLVYDYTVGLPLRTRRQSSNSVPLRRCP